MKRRASLPARIGIHAFLLSAALFFLLPLYIMLATSLKPMEEIRLGNIFALPMQPTLEPWRVAWQGACDGGACPALRGGFWNSVAIALPSTVLPILFGALNGYALSFWKPRGAQLLFGVLMVGAFIPLQVMVFPLVRLLGAAGLFEIF